MRPEILRQIESYVIPPEMPGDYHEYILSRLEHTFSTLQRQSVTPGVSSWELPFDNPGFNPPYMIAFGDNNRIVRGFSTLANRPMYVPDVYSAVYTTAAYIEPSWRGRGILKTLLTSGITLLETHQHELHRKAATPLPLLLIENIVIPDKDLFRAERDHIRAALGCCGYSPLPGTGLNTWYRFIGHTASEMATPAS